MTFTEQQNGTLYYKLRLDSGSQLNASQELRLGEILLLIDGNKEKLGIESFSLSETTLEQVFLSLVKTNDSVNRTAAPILAKTTNPEDKMKKTSCQQPSAVRAGAVAKARKKANLSREDDSYETDITLVSYRQSEESFFEDSRLSLRDSFTEIKL